MLQRPRGTTDRLPEDAPAWRRVTDVFERQCRLRGYQPIGTPTFEPTEMFSRGTGESTDIVQKEMYTFEDRGGDSFTLRPEGTPSVMRAYVQNGLHNRPQPAKLSYIMPMFRYDRPQAGRHREHHQIGAEALGEASASVDAEVIDLLWSTLQALQITGLELRLNSLGDPETRDEYRQALVAHFTPLLHDLCADCRERLRTNPLRLLDCKKTGCLAAGAEAPKSLDYIEDAARAHFEALQSLLGTLAIPVSIDHRLVRGLDYYNRTVFEIVPPDARAQSTVGGGGRYDYLAEALGGPHVPGVGFSAGIERIILNLKRSDVNFETPPGPDVFVAPLVDEAIGLSVQLAAGLRGAGIATETGFRAGSARSHLRRANGLGTRVVIIIGPRELEAGRVSLKPLDGGDQREVAPGDVAAAVAQMLAEGTRA